MIRSKDVLIVAIVFVLWLLFFKDSTYIGKKVDFSDMHNYRKVVEVHDTIYKNVYRNLYKKGDSIPYVIIATDTTTIHDTIQALSDYILKYAYSDTINVDSSTFVVNDTISRNKILSRSFEAKIREKTIITKQLYVEKPTNSLYLGIRGDFRPLNSLEVLSPSLMLSVKNKALIGLSVDIYKNYNIGYSGSLYFKIGKK